MKILNRNHLKLIALITMLIDHIGIVFLPEIELFRIIGRLSFPIFAYFIAEGWYYTKNRAKYTLIIAIFALITQPIYHFALNDSRLNILFTFLLSIALMCLIDKCTTKNIEFIIYLLVFLLVLTFVSTLNFIDYGLLGVLLPVIFYMFRDNQIKYLISTITIAIFSILFSDIQLFSIISIVLLYMYNGKKGKLNLKYAFYIIYPAHMIILYLIALLI
jgi:hypothetical protein